MGHEHPTDTTAGHTAWLLYMPAYTTSMLATASSVRLAGC